ncbi:MAG: hypothetical protein HFE85_05740, partial [Clostridiales bacterium]|nr:hypothetical protein [Clostridiales bacterium]
MAASSLRRQIGVQLYQMFHKKEFLISFSIMLFYAIGVHLYYTVFFQGWDHQDIYRADTVFAANEGTILIFFFLFLFPLLVSLPFSVSAVSD